MNRLDYLLALAMMLGAGSLAMAQPPALKTAEATEAADEVHWLRSATEAASQARQSGKLILVYIRNDNCRFCDLLQKNTWQDPRTRTLVERKTVPLKLTWEENREAVEAMQVTSYPSTLLFTSDRRFLARIDGYVTPAEFQQRFARVQADLSELAPSARPR